jgi:hypothetical protein
MISRRRRISPSINNSVRSLLRKLAMWDFNPVETSVPEKSLCKYIIVRLMCRTGMEQWVGHRNPTRCVPDHDYPQVLPRDPQETQSLFPVNVNVAFEGCRALGGALSELDTQSVLLLVADETISSRPARLRPHRR